MSEYCPDGEEYTTVADIFLYIVEGTNNAWLSFWSEKAGEWCGIPIAPEERAPCFESIPLQNVVEVTAPTIQTWSNDPTRN